MLNTTIIPTTDLAVLRLNPEYQEGFYTQPGQPAVIYLGTLNNIKSNKQHLKDDEVLAYYKGLPNSRGTVLNSENYGRAWSLEGNQAFILGAIEAGKTFTLVTPKKEYQQDYLTYTMIELLWLQDSGYQFNTDKNGRLTARPGPHVNPTIKSYQEGADSYSHSEVMAAKNAIIGFTPRVYTPSYHAGSSSKPQYSYFSTSSKNTSRFAPTNSPASTVSSWRTRPTTADTSKNLNNR